METISALPKIHIRKFDDTKSFTLYTEHSERVGSIRYEWFADHVVMAVNCHDELVKALKDIIREQGFMSDEQESLLVKAGALSKPEVA